MAERRSREVSEQAANRVRNARRLEEHVRREADEKVEAVLEASARLEAEVESLRIESGKTVSAAQQDIQRLRCVGRSGRARLHQQQRALIG